MRAAGVRHAGRAAWTLLLAAAAPCEAQIDPNISLTALADELWANTSRRLLAAGDALAEWNASYQAGLFRPRDFSLGPIVRGTRRDLATGGRADGFRQMVDLCRKHPQLGHGVATEVDGLFWWMPCLQRGPFADAPDSTYVYLFGMVNSSQECYAQIGEGPADPRATTNLTIPLDELLGTELHRPEPGDDGDPRVYVESRPSLDAAPIQGSPAQERYLRHGMYITQIGNTLVPNASAFNRTLTAVIESGATTVDLEITHTPESCQSWFSHWYCTNDFISWHFVDQVIYQARASRWYEISYEVPDRPYFTHVYSDFRCQCPVVTLAASYKDHTTGAHAGVFATDFSLADIAAALTAAWDSWVAAEWIPHGSGGLFIAEKSGMLVASTTGAVVSCAGCSDLSTEAPVRLSAFDLRAGPTVTAAVAVLTNATNLTAAAGIPRLARGGHWNKFGRVGGESYYVRAMPVRAWADPNSTTGGAEEWAEGVDWLGVLVLQGLAGEMAYAEFQESQIVPTEAPTPAPSLLPAQRLSPTAALAALTLAAAAAIP
eukprot:TRINITY_DN65395_c0_g1_i1.p1 TRINITY_DN65395_c0_g1~~TRINITY_DN65395_c0_g1_i1.p1  ORF type:complete len:570 (+),score=132.74 TRINITY_DN65395_c0_g1_i1:78-1712(+)